MLTALILQVPVIDNLDRVHRRRLKRFGRDVDCQLGHGCIPAQGVVNVRSLVAFISYVDVIVEICLWKRSRAREESWRASRVRYLIP